MRTAACLYVRDEARNIAEWAAYHLEIGFDQLFVYDNNSVDGTGQVAARLGASVSVIPWPFTDAHAQYKAYDHCVAHAAGRFDWVACIDVDEFIAFQPGWTLERLLSNREGCDAIALHWAFFGSNDHVDYPAAMTIEAFTRRAEIGFGPNRHVKSIVRPGHAGAAVSPHSFATPNYQLADGQPVAWQQSGITSTSADYAVCQLNHYFVRSRAHWADKMRRGYRDGSRDAAEFGFYDLNQVDDSIAAGLAGAVRARIARADMSAPGLPLAAALFDRVYYLMRYPDVAQSTYPADQHFWLHGMAEGRDPNPFLDIGWYAETFLAGDRGAAYVHFLSIGAAAGLAPRASLA